MSMLLAVILAVQGGQERASFEKLSFPFEGEVTASNLYVRMAPRIDPTVPQATVLRQGAKVTVVAETGDFFQILPPPGCHVWIFAKNVKREGAEGIVTTNDTPVRMDSRVNADQVCTLREGDKVKVVAEHMGWFKIEAPQAVKYFVARKYVKFVKGAEAKSEPKTEPKKADEDAIAAAKIREAEALVAEMQKKIEGGDIEGADFSGIVALFEEAASIAKAEAIKKEAEAGAKTYRNFQTVLATVKAGKLKIDEMREAFRAEQAKARAPETKKFAFTGFVDTTSWTMSDRPGTHKLILGDKVVCFLKTKDGDAEMLKQLNGNYKTYVGVNGTIIKNPPGWEGFSLVVVEEIVRIAKPK